MSLAAARLPREPGTPCIWPFAEAPDALSPRRACGTQPNSQEPTANNRKATAPQRRSLSQGTNCGKRAENSLRAEG
jgi:hypothetical protein